MTRQTGKIRVMIVNDHPIMRVGLRMAIQREADLELVCEAGDGAEALAQFQHCRPDVVLIDLQPPHGSGPHAIETIHALHPRTPVVMLTTFPADADIPVRGTGAPIVCVSKAAPSEDIVAAIRVLIADGHPPMRG